MCSSPENETWVKKMYQERTKQKLSTAALETLAITAYKQPITRVEIEAIRGVNVDGVVRKLTDLGLIKIGGRKDVVGKPFLYITTRKFLEYFGINTLKDLPKLEEFAALADKDINQTIENANRQVEGVEEKSEEVKGVGNQEKENKEEDNIEGEVVNKEIEVGKNNKEI
jgi:segregation and condensation protein B